MGHCISAIILKGKFDDEIAKAFDLLGVNLDFDLTLFPVDHYYSACWSKMLNISGQLPGKMPHQSMLMFPCPLVIASLMSQITRSEKPLYAVIETNYFGGVGEQWALVYRGSCLASDTITQINSALKYLGVKCQEGSDEFDTIGLGNYRTLPDYLAKYIALAEQLGV